MAYPREQTDYRPGWESDSEDGCGWEDSDSAEDDDSAMTPAQAGDALAETLLSLQNRGIISARWVCTLAFLSEKAGANGFVQKLSFHPNSNSGRCLGIHRR
jgi:hypothetical protein